MGERGPKNPKNVLIQDPWLLLLGTVITHAEFQKYTEIFYVLKSTL